MKTLKFRVWRNKSQEFIGRPKYPELVFTNLSLENRFYEDGSPAMIVEGSTISVSGDFIIQLYTGLLDNNGREIYEGDIVRETWQSNNPYGYSPDDWRDEQRIIEVKYEAPSFSLKDERGDGGQYCVQDFRREVIGNIFQNPELLTQ